MNTAQAIVKAMKAVVDGDVNTVIESLNIMAQSLQTIMDSMETLKSQSVVIIVSFMSFHIYRISCDHCECEHACSSPRLSRTVQGLKLLLHT